MKQLKHLLYFPFRLKYFFRLKENLKKHKHQPLVVFDIDNTLASTALVIKDHALSCTFYESLPVIYKMNAILKDYEAKGYHIFFLTARRYKYEYSTFKWLKDNGWINKKYQLLIVRFADEKLAFLDKMKTHPTKKIDYWDDLTYNHEKETLLFYDRVISEVKSKNWINYYGYDKIEK